ncbi:MAG: carboxypeptidase-like regulatory domain-containing protein [Acidimicrobiales bacterium]
MATRSVGRTGTARGLWVAVLAAIVALAGCTGVRSLHFAAPPRGALGTAATAGVPTSPPTLADASGVSLPPLPGRPTTTAGATAGGKASISGTVIGPAGPVGSATVVAQRVVGGAVGTLTATTMADGTFKFSGVRGGDYRMRAWSAPGLDLPAPSIFYLDARQDYQGDLVLVAVASAGAVGVFNPDPAAVGQPAALAVQVTSPTVGADGVVRSPVLAGAMVDLTNDPGWTVTGANPRTTGADGEATFVLTCLSAGSQPLDVSVNGATPVALNPQPCQAPLVPATTAPVLPTTTTTLFFGFGPGPTTTTTFSLFPPGP